MICNKCLCTESKNVWYIYGLVWASKNYLHGGGNTIQVVVFYYLRKNSSRASAARTLCFAAHQMCFRLWNFSPLVHCKCFAYRNYRFCLCSKSRLRSSVFLNKFCYRVYLEKFRIFELTFAQSYRQLPVKTRVEIWL